MFNSIKKSAQAKFVSIMLLTLIGVNGPLLASFFVVSTNSVERKMLEKKRAIVDVNSEAISKPLWDFDYENVEKWAESIARDRDIATVDILDYQDHPVATASNVSVHGAAPVGDDTVYAKQIFYAVDGKSSAVGTLRITFFADRIGDAVWQEVSKSALLFVVSTITVLGVALIAYRRLISTPLAQLTSVIESTHKPGEATRLVWDTEDELGKVTRAFNDMQDHLEADRAHIVKANKRHVYLYNNTPVMLFSVDDDDRIQRVSEYWLRATGYSPDDVIGSTFSRFISDASQDAYASRFEARDAGEHESRKTTLSFRKKDGGYMDVLLTETRDVDDLSGVRQWLAVMTDISKLKEAELQIRKQAQTDVVTGLLNRAGFAVCLERSIAHAEDGASIAVLFFDLDRFKWVNDNLGHQAGDEVLRVVAERVKPLLRRDDYFGRFGGDEFAITIAGDDIRERTVALAAHINKMVCAPIELDERTVQISASIGVSFYPENAGDVETLLKTSDVAMYRQKRDGRNGFCLYDAQFGAEAARQLEVESLISEGLKNDWFELYFQPIVDLVTQETVGFEGLLRLVHPELGIVQPTEFFTVAEQSGHVVEIGDRVIELGCEALRELDVEHGMPGAYVAINLAAAQFQPDLTAKIAHCLAERNVPPQRLVLEITENVLIQEKSGLIDIFDDLVALGCRFALDDFGTGYSSLSYINRFPVSTIKIDRSFISEMECHTGPAKQEKTIALIEGIVGLSQRLGFTVVAEGIETECQLARLVEMEIDNGQGYLFSPAEPLEAFFTDGDIRRYADAFSSPVPRKRA